MGFAFGQKLEIIELLLIVHFEIVRRRFRSANAPNFKYNMLHIKVYLKLNSNKGFF